VEHLVDVGVRLAALGGRADAPLHMILQDEHGERVDGGTKRRGLLEDVHAILLPLDHPADPADLPFDAAETAEEDRAVLGVRVAEMVAVVGVVDGARCPRESAGRSRRGAGRPRTAPARSGCCSWIGRASHHRRR